MVFDWSSVFWALGVFGALLIFATILFIPETRPKTVSDVHKSPSALISLGTLFRTPDFVVGILLTTRVFGGYAVLLSIGATIAEDPYGIPAQLFGFLFAAAAVASVAGSVGARLMAPSLGLEKVITTGSTIVGAVVLGAMLFDSTHYALSTLMGCAGLLCYLIRIVDRATKASTTNQLP